MFFRQLLPGLQSGNLCEGHLQVSACELGERFGFFGHGARILSLPSTGRGQNRRVEVYVVPEGSIGGAAVPPSNAVATKRLPEATTSALSDDGIK